MDTKRIILYGALGLVIYFIWDAWQKDYHPVNQQQVQSRHEQHVQSDEERLLPSMPTQASSHREDVPALGTTQAANNHDNVIHVKTDVMALTIDLNQGSIIEAKLLDYYQSQEDTKPVELLHDELSHRYIAKSQLLRVEDARAKDVELKYTAAASRYDLGSNQKQLVVDLTGTTPDGLHVTKRFSIDRGSYLVKVSYALDNKGSSAWTGYLNTQLLRTMPEAEHGSFLPGSSSYTGASYSQPGEHRYKKVSFKDMGKGNLDTTSKGGWIAMQQHYFLTAWVPQENADSRFYTRNFNGNYVIGSVSPPVTVKAGEQQVVGAELYVGPEITSTLKEIAPGLDLTVDYGWLWFISSLLFSVMKAIYSVVGNWGWAIVLVTVFIKLLFYRLSATSYKSMANMRKLQPKIQALRDRYGDDKAKLSQATMELYKQEKLNPLGGCLPILVQLPVFIALYWVLIESVELRQAPFILWITDLSTADPYHVLPIIMGLTMLIQQKLNPAPPDPMQAKVMMFLPVLFTGLFWNFPAGLVLYWAVQNILSILQQWYITRKFAEPQAKPATT